MAAQEMGLVAKSAEPLTFSFNKCPTIIKFEIVMRALALPDKLVCPLSGNEWLWLGKEERAIWERVNRLSAVNAEFAAFIELVLPMQRVRNLERPERVAGMDPKRDILLTSNMRVPKMLRWVDRSLGEEYYTWQSRCPGRYAAMDGTSAILPVREIISYAQPGGKPILHCREPHIHQEVTSLLASWFDIVPLRFHIDIPQLPLLRDVTLVWESTGEDFEVEGYEVLGPHPIGGPIEGSQYRYYMNGYLTKDELEAARMFHQKGIPTDSGVEWAMLRNESMDPGERFSLECDIPPLIGLDAYTETRTALGGQWAGFRVNEPTREVYFRPLKWHEVKHAVQSCEGWDKENRQGREQTDVHLAIRVWRTWNTDQTQPDGWTKVSESDPTNPIAARQIANLWKLAVGMIEASKGFGSRYGRDYVYINFDKDFGTRFEANEVMNVDEMI